MVSAMAESPAPGAAWVEMPSAIAGPRRACGKNGPVSSRPFVCSSVVIPLLGLIAACVPTGSAPPYDAGPAPAQTTAFKPSLNVMTAPFEDNFDRPDAEATTALLGDPSTSPSQAIERGADAARATAVNEAGAAVLLTEAGADASDRRTPSNLGPNWLPMKTNAWRVENGRLCVDNAHNHGIWLNRTLPVNARIEFDAMAMTEGGDLKAEVWGDGKSFATGTSYTNATSYLTILGGWKNTIHAIARLNEHGNDRKDIHVDKDSDDPRQRAVVRGQLYQFKIERTDGKTVRWSVNGVDYLSWNDPAPLAGQGHDHFGFNEWEAKVCFDNVKVTPL